MIKMVPMKRLCCLWILCSFCLLTTAMPADRNASFDDLVQKGEAGDAEAQFQLGQAYDEGHDFPQNDELAIQWYK